MDIYEDLVRARESKNPEYRMQMLEMERKKDFDRRIHDLRSKIQADELKIQEWRYKLDGLGNNYKPQAFNNYFTITFYNIITLVDFS